MCAGDATDSQPVEVMRIAKTPIYRTGLELRRHERPIKAPLRDRTPRFKHFRSVFSSVRARPAVEGERENAQFSTVRPDCLRMSLSCPGCQGSEDNLLKGAGIVHTVARPS